MKLLVIFVVALIAVAKIVCEEDLYNVLGIRKTASNAEIKRAYKRLAREWHPDKNSAPGANERFMKINEAYETLTDQDKRAQYDNFGTTSAQGGQQHRTPGNPFGGFEHFFQQGKFSFNFGGFKSDNIVDNQRITLRAYLTKILPESRFKPTLLYVYSDFCYHCMQVEMIWEKVTQDMEEIGVGIGSVQMQLDRPLASKLRISNVPSIVGVVDGRLRYFGNLYSVSAIRTFVRTQFYPPETVKEVNDKNYAAFLEGWKDNRVRMLLFDNRQEPTLRYMAAAFANRDRVAAGYVNIQMWGTKELQSRFNIQNGMETLLLFNEETQKPTAALTMKQLPRSTLDQLIDSNRFLQLPRLSSQSVFNQLCPVTTALNRKKLCVVLLSKSIEEHEPYRETFRKYAQDHVDPKERVRYAYVYEDSQYHFVNKLTKGLGIFNETNLKVAILWRKEQKTLHFDWLEDGWPLELADVKLTRRRLYRLVDWFLSGSTVLPLAVEMSGDLVDEYAENLGWRILKRIADWADALWEKLLSLDDVTVVTMVMSVVFVFVIGYMMRTLAHMEEDNVNPSKRRQQARAGRGGADTQNADQLQRPTVYMHHLTHETFESLIERNQFGVRTIVIFVDEESQNKLIQQFAQVVLPYARSDAFKFALLRVDQYLQWFRTILEGTLDSKRNLKGINQKNCIGTVLAVNGPRKYYCMYHAQQTQEAATAKHSTDGKFMGFDDSDSDSEEDAAAQKLFESDLLKGFSYWMDKLCEGTLRRFRVDTWPKMEPPSSNEREWEVDF